MSRKPLRDFALLHECWYEDDVLQAIAEESTPMVMAYLPMLIARCRAKSHPDDNPDGWIGPLTLRSVAKLVCDEPGRGESETDWSKDRKRMWGELVAGEIAEADGDLDARFRVRLIQFRKYQTPKGGSTDRTRDQRARAGESSEIGTPVGREGDGVGQDGTHSDRDREKGIVSRRGSAYAPTPELNPDLTACFNVVRMFAVPGDLERWVELLNQHRASNAQAPVECWANAMLKVSAYAAEHHNSRLAIGRAWNRFHRDFGWARQDAHKLAPDAPYDVDAEVDAAEAKAAAMRAAEDAAIAAHHANQQGQVAS